MYQLFSTNISRALVLGLWCLILIVQPSYAQKDKANFSIPIPKSYNNYSLRVNTSNRRPEVDEVLILKAEVSPVVAADNITYQFYINGRSLGKGGAHRVYSFEDTGTYKITVVATIGSFLINSPPIILHVVDAWSQPEAIIDPEVLTVKQGEIAQFVSLSEVAEQSRQWLYWSLNTGHKSNLDNFNIDTKRLSPGRYPIQLLVKDDRGREEVARAVLIVTSSSVQEPLDVAIESKGSPVVKKPDEVDKKFELRSSHHHQLTYMSVVFWLQNTQYGPDTELRFSPGDNTEYPWSKKIRYNHHYENIGFYSAKMYFRSPEGEGQSNSVLVTVWPRWLPLVIMVFGLLLAILPFYRRFRRQQPTDSDQKIESGLGYKHQPAQGRYQITFNATEQEIISFQFEVQHVKGQQSITPKEDEET